MEPDDNAGFGLWMTEIHQGNIGLTFRVEKTLFSGKSPYQRVDVVETAGHGRMLLNDGIVMLSERDEFVYHEMIAHVPLFLHPDPRRVLIIGGGDGGTAREVLRHPGLERVVMVEIDEMVISACKEHMPQVAASLDDPRLTLLVDDGVKYVAEAAGAEDRFDVVIVDSTDPIGPAEPLFNKDFYARVAEILDDSGILVCQAESPFYDTDLQRHLLGNQRPFFSRLHLYLFSTLTYPGGLWSFSLATQGRCPVTDFSPGRVPAAGFTTRYYTPEIHRAAFMLPTFLQEALKPLLDPVPSPFAEG